MSIVRLAAAAMSGPLGAPNVVSLSDDSSSGGGGGTAGFVFDNAGAVSRYDVGYPNVVGYWLAPQTNISEYEIRFTSTSGDPPTTGTLNTWMALSTSRSIRLISSTPDETLAGTVLAEIRWTGNNIVQDSATYTLTASGPPEL